ncbi:MAG: hypothetical protein ACRDDH_09305 [Cetobacterium sp.]|uniref:hypothetical protein n=1 Tax=Cetobacterium sp. TaxID=2071632 RepID=UPI003EE4409C
MKDILRLARCNENELNSFLPTLNDYTLVFTKDTHTLYTKQGEQRVFLGTGSSLFKMDQPILKDFRMYATNDDNIPIVRGRFYGLAGNEDKTYRLTRALQYDGEMLGILEDTTKTDGKYTINLITNLNVFTDDEAGIKLWDPVFVGKYQDNIISVTDSSKLDDVYGIAGVVTEVTDNKKVGRYTFNSFLLQSTYFSRKNIDIELVKEIIKALLSSYYTKDEMDQKLLDLFKSIGDVLEGINNRIFNTEQKVISLETATSDMYRKNEINIKLHDKANVSNVYNKTEIDGKMNRKYDKNETFSKDEIRNEIDSHLHTAGALSDAYGWIRKDVDNKYEIKATPNDFISFVSDSESDVIVSTSVSDASKIKLKINPGATINESRVRAIVGEEVPPMIINKVDKTHLDEELHKKADVTYLEAVRNTLESELDTKADDRSVYHRYEIDTFLSNKANKLDVYPKDETYDRNEINQKITENGILSDSKGWIHEQPDKSYLIKPTPGDFIDFIDKTSSNVMVIASPTETGKVVLRAPDGGGGPTSGITEDRAKELIVGMVPGLTADKAEKDKVYEKDETYTKQEVVNEIEHRISSGGTLDRATGWVHVNSSNIYDIKPTPHQFEAFVDKAASNVEITTSATDATQIVLTSTSALPDPPQELGLFGIKSDKTYEKIVPKNVITGTGNLPNDSLLMATGASGERWYKTSNWKIGRRSLKNTVGSMTLEAGGDTADGVLNLGSIATDSFGIATEKNNNVNGIKIHGDKVYHISGPKDNAEVRRILTIEDFKDFATEDQVKSIITEEVPKLILGKADKSDTYTKQEVDDKISSGGGSGQPPIKELRLDPTDKRILQIVLENGTIISTDLSSGVSAFMAKGGAVLRHQLKDTSWDNFAFEGKFEVGEEFPIDITVGDSQKIKGGRINVYDDPTDGPLFRIEDPTVMVEFDISTEGRWRAFTETGSTLPGSFTLELIAYQRRIGDPNWSRVKSMFIDAVPSDSDKYGFSLKSNGMIFTTFNSGVDLKYTLKVTSIPTGASYSGEIIRFGLTQDLSHSAPKYQIINLVFEKIPQQDWKPFTVTKGGI